MFPGMATQWNQMGKDLLKVPLFKQTIERCHKILANKKLDLLNIITTDDKSIFENVLNSFVGIGAVQIGMINLLREIGIKEDYLTGASFGEVATGYADGCLTEEQAILCAYYRGFVVVNGSSVVGRMAWIGMGFEKIQEFKPEDLDDASHIDANVCTLAGPKESVEKFVTFMKEQNIFTAILESSNIAFHSRYISHLAPILLEHLNKVIPEPKTRSKKWFSSSVPYERWSEDRFKVCSGEYYVNNLLSCVYLEETCKLLPRNSIILEIAPNGLLRTTIKNNFPDGVYVTLGDKRKTNNIEVFLEALRALDENGVDVNWGNVFNIFGTGK